MAVESKPLFHPEVIRQQVRSFALPDRMQDAQPKLQYWADLIASGRADEFKETALLPDFLTDIFCGLLGYTGPAGATDTFTLSRERHVEVDGKVADAVLGRFHQDQAQFTIALEGKGTRDPLDRPFAGRRMSAVDQAYRYAINLPCDWIIVTSMRETRLYHNPMKNPRVADEWEPYLREKRDENARLTRALNDAEAELNDRVYRVFDLTADEIKLLQKEVEH